MAIICKQNIQSMSILIYKIAVKNNLVKIFRLWVFWCTVSWQQQIGTTQTRIKIKYQYDNYITKSFKKYSEYEYFDLQDSS